jgi:hypothetical protein
MTISATTQGLRPGVCLSTSRPSTPFDGQVIYETDTNRVAVYDTNAWVYKTGTDFVDAVSYTPTWTNLTVGNGTVTARYTQVGKFVYVVVKVIFGSTTSISGTVTFTAPIAAHSSMMDCLIGNSRMVNAGIESFTGTVLLEGSTTIYPLVYSAGGTYTGFNAINATLPFTFGTSDSIILTFSYLAA